MKQTDPLYQGLLDTISGRLRIKLFEKITGKKNVIPLKKDSAEFITNIGKSFFEFAELFTYILTDGSYSAIKNEDLEKPRDIRGLLNDADENPLSKPALFHVENFENINSLCAWVKCDLLNDESGYFYTFIYFDEFEFPDKCFSFIQIRSSIKSPEPAIVFNENEETKILSLESEYLNDFPFVGLSFKLLNFISEHLFDYFTSLKNWTKLTTLYSLKNIRKINGFLIL